MNMRPHTIGHVLHKLYNRGGWKQAEEFLRAWNGLPRRNWAFGVDPAVELLKFRPSHPSSYPSWSAWVGAWRQYQKAVILGKLPRYGTQSSSGTSTSVTTADSWTNMYNDTTPAGMKRLKKIRFGIAPDGGATAASIRQAPAFRLSGSGLLEQSPHNFLGMFGGYACVTTAGLAQSIMDIEYDVDIPVQVGGTVAFDFNILREAQTAGSVNGMLAYDEQPPKTPNSMADYVEAAVGGAADAWSTIGTYNVPTGAGANSPKRIRAIAVAIAPDQGTSAVSLRISTRMRLSGSGLAEGGTHEFTGPSGQSNEMGTSASQGVAHDRCTVVIVLDIPVNSAGTILSEQRQDGEVATGGSFASGILYG